jgi:hypothetical protein
MPSRRFGYVHYLLFGSLLLLARPSPVASQSFNGAITGVVRDSTSGVLPGVSLTLRNVATDQRWARR